MKKIFLLFTLLFSSIFAGERADLIVAKDDSGDFLKIQDALDAVPKGNEKLFIILVKDGLYKEKLIIRESNIAIVGESKEKTIIQFAEIRKKWMESHDNHFGSAVVNIAANTTDITLANLTIHNNYGSLYGDDDHQYAILGLGTKVILIHCNVIADGADTVSLWPEDGGMFYHSHCYFEGHVDYVCPRGWCYITDSKFFGHNLTASLWHKGIDDKSAKFVIRYSYFDGVKGFPLGRHHYDAQFYLLDCIFSENMADIPIFWPVSPNAHVWEWGTRHYFHNCQRLGGDYKWFENNLSSAEDSPAPGMVTAKWTFDGKWDPETEMPRILPFTFLPKPRNGEYLNSTNTLLTWVPSRNAESFDVYFWKSKYPQALDFGEKLKDGPSAPGKPVFVNNQNSNIFDPGKLQPNSTYYWRIDELIDGKKVEGKLWHFTTPE
ncbi:MAG: hypothetical protein SCALA702_29060 [Melioribacteraceae bacterium]|nr:MAG: hypothetical protein SCALA702_29060 [Melioribacteraceae bacterium]